MAEINPFVGSLIDWYFRFRNVYRLFQSHGRSSYLGASSPVQGEYLWRVKKLSQNKIIQVSFNWKECAYKAQLLRFMLVSAHVDKGNVQCVVLNKRNNLRYIVTEWQRDLKWTYGETRMHSSRMRTTRSSSRPEGESPPGTPRTRCPPEQTPPWTRHPPDQAPPPLWTESQTPVKM